MFGNPETTTGGNALKFYSSVRLDIRKISAIKSGDEIIGNQVRVKVVKNKVAPPFRKAEFDIMFGNPETTPGGRALKFYSTIRLDVRRSEQIKVNGDVVGNKTVIKVVKNKVAPPFKTAEVEIMYGEGISKTGEVVDLAANMGIIDKSGAWFSYKGEKIGQGKENVKLVFKNNPNLYKEIEEMVRNDLFNGTKETENKDEE
jgi:recombination protein RecA